MRRSKTFEQQCRYYEVDNIFDYLISVYNNGNLSQFREIYKEFNKETRADFIDYVLSMSEQTKANAMVSLLQR